MSDSSTDTLDRLFQQWNGQLVPWTFNGGFVALSYVVSLIGAMSTLELINRRTAPKGLSNHVLLVSAAVTMGGIAIWCMHYIGNRAIDLAGGETELQIHYSSSFTALSFFVPIGVLLAAFLAIGTNNAISWWRVAAGGVMAGGAICGMHYLGNASIQNYRCTYTIVNVVGAAVIAVVASFIALSLFFVFRAAWTSSWWKRCLSAVVLAGAVSGMHWCAAAGTSYRLVALNADSSDRYTTVVVVICLSVGACFVMAGTALYTARIMKRYANKAQQMVLAAAVFDKQGRLLVSPDGLLPSEKITDTFLEKTPQDSFTVAHPLFHWMFQASRNWTSIAGIISAMNNHLARLPHSERDLSRGGIKLIDERGEHIENYGIILRELFCAAALALAEKTKLSLSDVGILWDKILPTGTGGSLSGGGGGSAEDMAEKGTWTPRHNEFGRGSLMFLVRRVESGREMEALEAAGYRFAELHQISGIIGSGMQIQTKSIETELGDMATFADQQNSMLEQGVHLGLFAVRARVGESLPGFDVLVKRAARNQLPSVQMPVKRLEEWHTAFLSRLDRLPPKAILKKLVGTTQLSEKESLFATQLRSSLHLLRAWTDDPIFEDALLTSRIVKVPCRSATNPATMIAFRLVVPIHLNVSSRNCEFIPLNFFRVHQMVHTCSSGFSRSIHREMSPILSITTDPAVEKPKPVAQRGKLSRLRHLGKRAYGPLDSESSNSAPATGFRLRSRSSSLTNGSTQSNSAIMKQLWDGAPRSSNDMHGPSPYPAAEGVSPANQGLQRSRSKAKFGGIMVSQEITVDVQDAADEQPSRLNTVTTRGEGMEMKAFDVSSPATRASHNAEVGLPEEAPVPSFVDELFAICVDNRSGLQEEWE